MINALRNFLATVGLVGLSLLTIAFWQNTKIKLDLLNSFASKALGLGEDYSGFVANEFKDFKDILIRGTLWKFSGDKLDNLNIELSYENVLLLEKQRQNLIEGGYRAKGNLIFNDRKKIKIKIRAKGDRQLHREDFTNMSFKIDVKGSARVFGLEEFSIQRPLLRNYGCELLISKIAKKQGLIAPKIKPVVFSINGKKRGIYFIEESYTEESLELGNKKIGPIFSVDETQGSVFPNVVYDVSGNKKIDDDAEQINQHAYKKLLDFRNNFTLPNFEQSSYFDLDLWARYFAVIDLFGSFHGAVPKSVKLYFNPSTQLFEPLIFDNHVGGANYTNFSLIDFFTNTKFNYEICGMACSNADWFKVFFSDQKLVAKYAFYVSKLIDDFNNEEFSLEIAEVEKFNDAMYSYFAPSDRVFAAGLLPYYMDIDHIKRRSSLISAKLKEITYVEDDLASSFSRNMVDQNFCLIPKVDLQICKSLVLAPDVKLTVLENLNLKNDSLIINHNEVIMLIGDTVISNAQIKGSKKSMLVQLGGNIFLEDVTLSQVGNIKLSPTNWTGALNIIKAKAKLDNVKFQNTFGEDALNTVHSQVNAQSLLSFEDIPSDAFDSDFSNIVFERIVCKNVGNDCLDTSGSIVRGLEVNGDAVGDKLLSFGENSLVNLDNGVCAKCGIGIAVKDSSDATVGSVEFSDTPLKLSVFQKKKFFGPAILKVNQLRNSISNNDVLVGGESQIQFSDQLLNGSTSDILVKRRQYGNEYGVSSKK